MTVKTSPPAEGAFGLLIPEIRQAVEEEGYRCPTPIQEGCIAPILEGRDVIGSAQTGTGKTAAFTLPMLQRLRGMGPSRRGPRALVLAPTRELAAQIGESLAAYGRHVELRHTVIFGGVSAQPQLQALRRGVDVVVATPGRLLDLLSQGGLRLDSVAFFVLDEVDRMLDMGFLPDVRRVIGQLPAERQTLFFSATLAPNMLRLANELVRDPVRVGIAPEKPTAERIDQKVLFVGKGDKDRLLVDLLRRPEMSRTIVFTQMKHAANKVVQRLEASGIRGAAIHGNKSQGARTRALEGFKSGAFQVLVATDVAARGIDVDDISHVVNYDLPLEAETYVHRIGRTARAGASGGAISFCCAEERACLRGIEKLLGAPVPVEESHPWHCEVSKHSTLPPPKQGGGGRGRQPGSRRSEGPRGDGAGRDAGHRPRSGSRGGYRGRSA